MPERELVILTPNLTKPEQFEEVKEDRPFLMCGELPSGAEFIQMVSIPTVIDMFGLSSGGGPPGFAYLVDPEEEDKDGYIFLLLGPSMPIEFATNYQVVGVVHCLGMLLGAVQIRGSVKSMTSTVDKFRAEGSPVFDMIRYHIPDIMKHRAFSTQTQESFFGQGFRTSPSKGSR